MKFITCEKIIYISALKKNIMKIRALNPKIPIAYPIGMTNSPSPKEAHMAKLAVFDGFSAYPTSWAIEKNRAYIAERKIPELITPA